MTRSNDTPDLIANLSAMALDLRIQTANLASYLQAEHSPDFQGALGLLDAAYGKLEELRGQYAKAA